MTRYHVFSALCGLAGAVNNNGKTDSTDAVVIDAILSEDYDAATKAVREEKFKISPGCASCDHPCGNTSDYDVEKWDNDILEEKVVKQVVMDQLVLIARAAKEQSLSVFPEVGYKAIAYLGYEMEVPSYERLLKEMKEWLDR